MVQSLFDIFLLVLRLRGEGRRTGEGNFFLPRHSINRILYSIITIFLVAEYFSVLS